MFYLGNELVRYSIPVCPLYKSDDVYEQALKGWRK